jgi:hypothetical protein
MHTAQYYHLMIEKKNPVQNSSWTPEVYLLYIRPISLRFRKVRRSIFGSASACCAAGAKFKFSARRPREVFPSGDKEMDKNIGEYRWMNVCMNVMELMHIEKY